jgi:hypothetical protein
MHYQRESTFSNAEHPRRFSGRPKGASIKFVLGKVLTQKHNHAAKTESWYTGAARAGVPDFTGESR